MILVRADKGDPGADIERLRRGDPIVVSAFLRKRGSFKQGRLVLCAANQDPITWESYRFLRAYRPVKFLHPPYDVRGIGPVDGPGAWNVNSRLFKKVNLNAGPESVEIAIPEIDLEFFQNALAWLNRASL
jgi:hypothetical protein